MPWYFAESGERVGPVEDAEFQTLVAIGRVKPEMLVWRKGMAQWEPYRNLNGAASAATVHVPGQQTCWECHGSFPANLLATFGRVLVCPNCRPLFTQKLREGVPAGGAITYGGFWIRVLAVFIDTLILGIVALTYTGAVLSSVTFTFPGDTPTIYRVELILLAINFAVGIVFETWFVGRFGATPGKMFCQLKVVRSDGRRIGYLRSLGRHLAKTLDWFTLGIGFVLAVFDPDRRTLHDRICDTRVVRSVPDPLLTSGGCPECHAALPPDTWNLNFPARCPNCRALLTAMAFPAQVRQNLPAMPEPVGEAGEATCFFHVSNKAAIPCDQCGRFLCTLCRVEISGANWCPSCIERERTNGMLSYLDNRRMMYDNLALLLALMPIVLFPFWPIAVISAPATLFVVFYYWRKLESLVPRTKGRFIAAAIIASLEILFLFIALLLLLSYPGIVLQ